MDNFKWRFLSRIAAIVDLVLSGFSLMVLILLLAAIATDPTIFIEEPEEENLFEGDKSIRTWIMGIALITASGVVAFGMFSAVEFLEATKKGADHVNAVSKARFWRRLHIVFLILSAGEFFDGTLYSMVSAFAGISYEGILIYIVSNFIEELDQVINIHSVYDLDMV